MSLRLRAIAGASFVAMLGMNPSTAENIALQLAPWKATTSFSGPRTSLAAVISNNRIFLLGGLSSTAGDFTLYADVQSATLGNDGDVTSPGWQTTTALPTARSGLGAVIYQDRIYAVGGYAKNGTLAEALSAPLSAGGGIGAWSTSESHLNIPRSNLRLEVFKTPDGHSFLGAIAGVGEVGTDTVHFDSVEVAPVGTDGAIGGWRICPFHLKGGRSAPATVVENGVVYVMGGWGDRLDDVFRDVQYATIRNDGCPEPWQTAPNSLNMPLYGHVVTTTKIGQTTHAVVLGGNGGEGNYFNSVQVAPMTPGGGIGAWTFERHTLPVARWGHASVRYGDFIYIFGGAQIANPGYLDDVQFSAIGRPP